MYKKGIDRRVLFVYKRPGPNSEIKKEDIAVKRCWGKENANQSAKSLGNLERFYCVRKKYGLQNCYITENIA